MNFYPLSDSHAIAGWFVTAVTVVLLVIVPWRIAQAQIEQRPQRLWWTLEVAALLGLELAIGAVHEPWSLRSEGFDPRTEGGIWGFMALMYLLVVVLALALLVIAPRRLKRVHAAGQPRTTWWIVEAVGITLLVFSSRLLEIGLVLIRRIGAR